MLPHTRQSGKTMTSVSAGHIILTLTRPVGSRRGDRTYDLPTRSRAPLPLNITNRIYLAIWSSRNNFIKLMTRFEGMYGQIFGLRGSLGLISVWNVSLRISGSLFYVLSKLTIFTLKSIFFFIQIT